MNIKEIDSKILFKEFEVQVPYKEVDNSINAKIGFLTDHCNSTSAWLLGALPHRNVAGKKNKTPGIDAYNMIEKHLLSYIFFNLEPENDFWNNISVIESLKSSKSIYFPFGTTSTWIFFWGLMSWNDNT